MENLNFLPVGEENRLVATDLRRDQRKGMDNDDDYYDEVNRAGEVVARYHVWHHMSIYPPQQIDQGWRKFDLQGNVIGQGPKS